MTKVTDSPVGGIFQQGSNEAQLFRGMVEALTNNATVSFIVCDLTDTVLYVNETFESVFGWTREEAIGIPFLSIRKQDQAEFQDLLHTHRWELKQRETIRCRKDGTMLPTSETVAAIKNSSGEVTSYACVIRDITDRRQAERKLQESEQRFKSLFEQNPDAVISLSLEGNMTDVNPVAQSMIGLAADKLEGASLTEWIVPEEQLAFQLRFAQAKRSGTQHFDSALLDSIGNRVELNMKLLPIYIEDEIVGIYCIAKDITVHKRALETINFMAFHDSLTELPNRRLFHTRLTEVLHPATRNDEQIAVVWIDLDGFKQVNDTHGHAAGDFVLHEVAGRLRSSVRTEDLVARVGGDEFTILLKGFSGLEDVLRLAERLVQVLGEPMLYRQAELAVTPSIGIALHPEDGADGDTLMLRADTAMYQAKQNGKNGYRFYNQIS